MRKDLSPICTFLSLLASEAGVSSREDRWEVLGSEGAEVERRPRAGEWAPGGAKSWDRGRGRGRRGLLVDFCPLFIVGWMKGGQSSGEDGRVAGEERV